MNFVYMQQFSFFPREQRHGAVLHILQKRWWIMAAGGFSKLLEWLRPGSREGQTALCAPKVVFFGARRRRQADKASTMSPAPLLARPTTRLKNIRLPTHRTTMTETSNIITKQIVLLYIFCLSQFDQLVFYDKHYSCRPVHKVFCGQAADNAIESY